jgi:FixJ family two-component response regulator
MSGPDVVRLLRESTPGIRSLLISGYTDKAVTRHGIVDPGVMFLSKPFMPEEFARKVREALDTRSAAS